MYKQTITPTPNILCRPGWCLEYVRAAYGQPARYPTAIAAWNASTTKHRDQAFPAGVWVPLYFTVKGVPEGHIVLRAPDGSIYSTSDLGSTPHHHPDLADLLAYYARYGKPLTYLGWTEDVAGYRVVSYTAPAPQPAPVRAAGKLLTVSTQGAMVRTAPTVRAAVAPGYPAGLNRGAVVAAIGYVAGEDPYPRDGKLDNAWVKTKSGYYIWANNLGNSLAGLAKLN